MPTMHESSFEKCLPMLDPLLREKYMPKLWESEGWKYTKFVCESSQTRGSSLVGHYMQDLDKMIN